MLVRQKKNLRLGTGELSDSLAVDQETNYSKKILSIFEKFPSVVFEFKTKSAMVKNIVNVSQVLKNIVISWSLNPEEIISVEEPGAPTLAKRLQALNSVQSRGYKIGIHLDPIIFVKNWKGYYTHLIQNLANIIEPEQVAWISLGSLRFPSSLREYILKHKNSRLFSGELVRGYDEKYRYLKSLRLELFRYTVNKIRTLISKDIPLYLCMEDKETWEEIFPEIKPKSEDINKMLYLSVFGNK
jgi:spore photoproduct lyase